MIEEYGGIDVKGEEWIRATAGHHGTIPNAIPEDTQTFPNLEILDQDKQARKQ